MSELEKAARQALAALEVSTDWDVNATGKQAQSMRAITALRQAIEQQPTMIDEPVECMCGICKLGKREWVGLTDRERDQFFKYVTMTSLVKAIEAKLKEKNT